MRDSSGWNRLGQWHTSRYYEHAGDVVASRSLSDATGDKDTIWLGSDQHGSVSWALNSVTRVETIKYADPYAVERGGSVTWTAGQKGFVGGVEDPTGLTLLGARYYDSMLGAFISVDPEIDEYDPQRLHAYAYANNSPVAFADPDGLFFGKLANAASKAVGSVASAAKATASFVVENAGTISEVAGGIAMVAAVLPPPAQVVAAAAGAVAAVAGAIDTAKTCAGGDAMGCAMGIAEMVPGVRQAKNAVRGVGAIKNSVKFKCENSFLPGTLVLMADGSRVPIEDVRLGDVVQATDPQTGENGGRTVTALIKSQGEKALVQVVVDFDSDGQADGKVTATDNHPFWVESERQWLEANRLRPGDYLLTPDGARVAVIAVVAYGAVAGVHNLTVDGLHTYYVAAGPSLVLVHNSICYGELGVGGRATGVKATITKDMVDAREVTHPKVDPAGFKKGQGYHSGHLLGAQFGGSNKDRRNFVTMHGNANSVVMKDAEMRIRKAVDAGETVEYTATPLYRGNNVIPYAVTIHARGSGGFHYSGSIMNKPKLGARLKVSFDKPRSMRNLFP